MYGVLAYAEQSDSGVTNVELVVGGALILAVTAALAFALIYIARLRDHRQADFLVAAALLWAVCAAGSLLYAEISQMNWSKEYTTRLESGYLDPDDTSGAPKLPWAIWTALGVAYGAMLTWSLTQKRPTPPEA
jgi:hypothetical protein